MKRILTTLCTLLVSAGVSLPTAAHAKQFMPNNFLEFQRNVGPANITQDQFSQSIQQLQQLYAPIVAQHGGVLQIVGNWNDNTVNAYASRVGATWYVQMYGGLARRPEITPDGFKLVICHELGHQLGGFPFYPGDNEWAADEGNSDYFTTLACARKLWKDDPANSGYDSQISTFARQSCDAYWAQQPDRDLCYRTAAAGQSLANLLAQLDTGRNPDYSTPDRSRVQQTNHNHARAQCRLDTYLMGALCNVQFSETQIPGLNAPVGQDSIYAEAWAAYNSCHQASFWLDVPGASDAFRPGCWFKNTLDNPSQLQMF